MKIHWQQGLLVAIFAGCTLPAMTQTNGSNSPYSRYGFGLLNDRGQGFNRGMAGAGVALQHSKELNVTNPASYAAIDSASFIFDIGASLQLGTFNYEGASATAKNTSLDYITMGFRLRKGLGVSLGLLPFSTIGYNLQKNSPLHYAGSSITQTELYSGEGGLRYIYAGLGWQPIKNISVGANIGYLWGTQTHHVLANFSDPNIASRRRIYTADIRTYKLDLGMQYAHTIDKKNSISIGATYGLGHDISSTAYYHNQTLQGNFIKTTDTLALDNAFALPHSFQIGLAWHHNQRWRVAVDYSLQQWDKLRYPNLMEQPGGYQYTATTDQFSNRSKFSIGAEYVPNAEGMKRSQRIRYRLGAAYTDSYTKVAGQFGPRSYQVTAGVGLPIMNFYNNRSYLNLSVGYEHIAPRFAGQISENYFRVGIGITFNENWFSKWRVE